MRSTNQRDYFAEMYVAGILADAGWNVYFPRRDKGFDFVITKESAEKVIVRPVQVKGKYPEATTGDRAAHGFVGRLSLVHPDMALAIPFFSGQRNSNAPTLVAFLPLSKLRVVGRGYRCLPARYERGAPVARRDYLRYFDADGIAAMARENWR